MLKQGAPVREFADAATMMGHYAEVHRRIFDRAPAPQMPEDHGTRPLVELQRERARREAEEEEKLRAEERARCQAGAIALFGGALLARQPRTIITRVAHQHGFTYEDIIGKARHAPLVVARREAIGAVREAIPTMSLPLLGRHFGVDHTTILHALRRLKGMSGSEAKTARKTSGRRV